MNWAAFLDRDGVLVEYVDLLHKPEQLKLAPGAAAAVRRLREGGALAVVVTNQPAVARGLLDEKGLKEIHRKLESLLAEQGAKLDAIYYCPHHPDFGGECACRKPKTGMLLQAAKDMGIEIPNSFFIGDSTRDIQAARNAGCRSVLVRTGNAGKDGAYDAQPDAVCDDVLSAAEWVLAQ